MLEFLHGGTAHSTNISKITASAYFFLYCERQPGFLNPFGTLYFIICRLKYIENKKKRRLRHLLSSTTALAPSNASTNRNMLHPSRTRHSIVVIRTPFVWPPTINSSGRCRNHQLTVVVNSSLPIFLVLIITHIVRSIHSLYCRTRMRYEI